MTTQLAPTDLPEPADGMTEPPRPPLWRRIRGLSLVGCVGALLFFCFSMTPSLLPRPWVLQGAASAISMVLGYAVGALGAWGYRKLGLTELGAKGRRIGWLVLLGATVVLVPLFTVLGAVWQGEVRELIGVEADSGAVYLPLLAVALVLAVIMLAIGRGIRWVLVKAVALAARWVPPNAAKLVGVLVVALIALLLFNGTLVPAVRGAMNESFALVDQGTPDGIEQPTSALRSGGPESLVAWDELGFQGREFIGSGPDAAEISAFTGKPALEPIRAYAGMDAADDLAGVADLVVGELQRTGAFDRAVLVVAGTTGRGWVNPTASAALEYMWGGDTAVAAMQYSHFPSGIAFVADTATPPLAGRLLFRAVHRVWSQLPVDDRPKLFVLGESLGSFGSQGSFGSVEDLSARADGALWVGTPRFTPLWSDLTAEREPGSPEAVPVLDDCAVVCFVDQTSDLDGRNPRIVYLQYPTDAVIWWNADLLFNEPDWLKDGQRVGIPERMRWIPLVTFWQTTLDMILSANTPDGTGHHYGLDTVNAWAALTAPPGWTAEDTSALRDRIGVMPR